ncbi:MAG: hypothetical protein AB1734_10685 [Elusimicrobiota bacterium]
MKKPFHVVSMLPSLLIASTVILAASDRSVKELSDVGESVKEILQEQKDLQGKPVRPERPDRPDHPVKPPRPDNPNQPPKPPKPPQPPQPPPPQPPKPVDTTHAYNAGVRDGSVNGEREGRRNGYSEGVDDGEREGRRNGTNEGDRNGRQAGYNDGYTVDQSAGTHQGNIDGRNAGVTNGTAAGERRCYDEGYASGYNSAYAEARQLGLQDQASYSSGYAKGQADAAVMETENGRKAGYQAGFSQREAEIQASFPEMIAMAGGMEKGLTRGVLDLPIDLARNGYSTPEERQAYERGYREGYQRSYRRAYDDAKRQGYNERYHTAYRRAYDSQYSISYRSGYLDGKEKGYKAAYRTAYNTAYSMSYAEYSNRDYPEKRAQGLETGRMNGRTEGFEAGCAEQRKRGYNEGYQKKAAEVYPAAFEAGKASGVAAAGAYYAGNAVVKSFGVSFYDASGDGKFEAGESVMLRAELRNFGLQASDAVTITVKSERGGIALVSDLRADPVRGRASGMVNLDIGRLYDMVAPDQDALTVTFTEKGRPVGDHRQLYVRTNNNKVGIINKDDTAIKEKAGWLFVGTVAKLNAGEKVLIIGEKDDWYKVRKSAFAAGDWTEGFVKKGKLSLQ